MATTLQTLKMTTPQVVEHQSPSPTVLFRTTLTRTITLDKLMYAANSMLKKVFPMLFSILLQALFSVRTAVYHGRLFSTSYVAAQKVNYIVELAHAAALHANNEIETRMSVDCS